MYLDDRYQVRTEYRYPSHGFANKSHGDIAIEALQSFDGSAAYLFLDNRLDACCRERGGGLFENKHWFLPFTSKFYSERELISELEPNSVKVSRLMVAG